MKGYGSANYSAGDCTAFDFEARATAAIATHIISAFRGIKHVVYDVASKPPGPHQVGVARAPAVASRLSTVNDADEEACVSSDGCEDGMTQQEILNRISRGRTDLVFDLLRRADWQATLREGRIKLLQWFVYYNDVTALKAVLEAGGDLASLDLNAELGHAAFFGHWKVCDFLISQGADPRFADPETGETALHGALCKAGRPYYFYVVRLLVERGADVNARTAPDRESGAFMRDVRTKGETPLHRAAAFGDEAVIEFLLKQGADREARDANGDSPLTWASWHLRPGSILALLAFEPHCVSAKSRANLTSDHGAGWGNGMERNLLGVFLLESAPSDCSPTDS